MRQPERGQTLLYIFFSASGVARNLSYRVELGPQQRKLRLGHGMGDGRRPVSPACQQGRLPLHAPPPPGFVV
jgi:hypothetical protein